MTSRRAPCTHTQHAKQKETTFFFVGVGVYHLGLCYPWARGGVEGERSEFRNEQQEETTTQEENREGSTMSAAKTQARHRGFAWRSVMPPDHSLFPAENLLGFAPELG